MLIKRMAIFLPLFLFFVYSPTLALETMGTFRIINDKKEIIVSKEVSFQEEETLYEVTRRTFDIEESKVILYPSTVLPPFRRKIYIGLLL